MDAKEYAGTELEFMAALIAEAKRGFDSGEITKEEYVELLADIKRSGDIEAIADDAVLAGKFLTGISLLMKAV